MNLVASALYVFASMEKKGVYSFKVPLILVKVGNINDLSFFKFFLWNVFHSNDFTIFL